MDWWIIIEIIMNTISFILNGLFLFVLARNKDLVKRKRITYHVANIAVADTLYGLGSSCFYIVLLHRNEGTLKQFYVMSTVGYFASQTTVFLMTIERSIVITKPLTWNDILPRKRMLLIMLCSWIAVVTLVVFYFYLIWKAYTWSEGLHLVVHILRFVFLISSAAVNIYMFKYLRKKHGLAAAQQRSIHLKHKPSKLVLLLAVIMIVTCLPNSLLQIIWNICREYQLHCNLHLNLRILNAIYILENLNFIVNPLVYIWKDRIYRNAFYRTFKIKTAQF